MNADVDASRRAADSAHVTVEGASATVTVCTSAAAPEIVGEVAQVTVACEM